MSGDHALAVSRAALHELLTDAHTALIEHRPEWAGAVLHTLRRLTAPTAAEPQGRAARLKDEGLVAAATAAPPTIGADAGRTVVELHPITALSLRSPFKIDLPGGLGEGNPPAEAACHPPVPEPAQAAEDAPPTRPRVARRLGEWTFEREAVLRNRYPEEGASADVIAALNALPGRPIAGRNALHRRAFSLGLRLSAEAHRRRVLEGMRRVAASAPSEAPPEPTARRGAPKSTWTPEREALLRERFPIEGASDALLAAINALPGRAVSRRKAVTLRATELRVTMAPEARANSRRTALEAARAPKAERRADVPGRKPAPRLDAPAAIDHRTGRPLTGRGQAERTPRAGEGIEVRIIRPKGLTDEDIAEGERNILERGWNGMKVAEWFGVSLGAATDWCRTAREAAATAEAVAQAGEVSCEQGAA